MRLWLQLMSQEDFQYRWIYGTPKYLRRHKRHWTKLLYSRYILSIIFWNFSTTFEKEFEGSWKGRYWLSKAHMSLKRPAGQPLRTLQKGSYLLLLSPDIDIRRASNLVDFAIFPGCHIPANGHRFVGLGVYITEGKGHLLVYDEMRTFEGWY